ncbi:LacI family transcriptional regulator [Exilibacterium tricleocarpae]|uniref:LacI family transcriptional regulator n=1 Tax=Exilibacterium tricleocarpae TaxID=2591008 RepID=A0A545UA13_9GAMM|nr:LacI family DNA-binding transcriptional regulator [Exilibacterium tricleocarpae]TQV86243.1 LacI family transcriptional regulator [Exilibacterium tricleocarpae]
MATIKIDDIAAQAGVCKATVSRTLRNPDIVSPETRNKVMSVVDRLGYTPNRLGASLRQGSSHTIVVILPDITNPFFSPIVREIERVAIARGYSVLLGDTLDDPALERAFAKMVRSRQADGIIISSQRLPYDIDEQTQLALQLPPLVSIAEVVPTEGVHKVVVDNQEVGRTATRHLLELGHTRIAAIAGPTELRSSIDRLAGYRAALTEADITVDEKLICYGDYSSESGVEGTRQLMQHKQRPSAIFCLGDSVAIGALHILRELGYRVPEDISVIGVDGVAPAKYSAPPLTTVAQPMEQIGKISMETLLALIEGRKPEKTLNILPHELVVRGSTGPAPRE